MALLRDVQLLQRGDGVAAGEPDRGPGFGDRERAYRRRAAVRHRHGVVLRDHRDRRARHHQRDDFRWAAGTHREPRPAAAAAGQPGSDAAGHRGDDPVGHSRQGVHAHRAPRTPTVRGVPIAAGRVGSAVLRRRPTATRRSSTDPFRFDVGRDPNKHVAFGYGVHFCLGAALARMEVNSFFSELVPRLESVELAGGPSTSRPSSSAGSSTCRSATRSNELTAESSRFRAAGESRSPKNQKPHWL